MANDISKFTGLMVKLGALDLRKKIAIVRAVSQDFDEEERKRQGATIDFTVPARGAVRDVTPAASNPAPSSDARGFVRQIPLSNWRESTFTLTDKEKLEFQKRLALPAIASARIGELADDTAQTLAEKLFKKSTYRYGTAGTAPQSSTAIIQARKILNNNGAAGGMRSLCLHPDYAASLLNTNLFHDAQKTGTFEGLEMGNLGQKFGFSCAEEPNLSSIATITCGTHSGTTQLSAAVSVGDSSVTCDTGAGTAKEGEVFTVAGDSEKYVLTADVADLSSGTLSFFPEAKVAWADNAVVTFEEAASAVLTCYGLAIQRESSAFVSRPLQDAGNEEGLAMPESTTVDEVSGIVLRFGIYKEWRQVQYAYDILHGGDAVRPEAYAAIIG
jgi:hypothetical protein